MTLATPFATAAEAMAFIQAGNATITLRSKLTGTRYTYKVRENETGNLFFVSIMRGADNETDYSYIGIITGGTFRATAKSKVNASDVRFIAFAWAYKALSAGQLPAQLEVWHEGSCGRCGRKLTVPESIASGIGPECARKRGVVEADPLEQLDNVVVPLRRRRTR